MEATAPAAPSPFLNPPLGGDAFMGGSRTLNPHSTKYTVCGHDVYWGLDEAV